MNAEEFLFRSALWAARRATPVVGAQRVAALTARAWDRYVAYQLTKAASSRPGYSFLTEYTRVRIGDVAGAGRERGAIGVVRALGRHLPAVSRFLDVAPSNGMLAHGVLRDFAEARVTLVEPDAERAAILAQNLSIHSAHRIEIEREAEGFRGWRVPPMFDAARLFLADTGELARAKDVLRLLRWVWIDFDRNLPGDAAARTAAALRSVGFVVYGPRGRDALSLWMERNHDADVPPAYLVGVNHRISMSTSPDEELGAARISFSQEGEDLILARMFPRGGGFYVDVGAHDPFRFSNTCAFYLAGWRGINIDASDAAIHRFQKYRPGDVNVHSGVGETEGSLTFFEFNEPALNTFSEQRARELQAAHAEYTVMRTVTVPVRRLEHVLAQHLPAGQAIDFLTIDVEGLDLDVLRSNDWARFRPVAVVVEELDIGAWPLETGSPAVEFMHSVGYGLYAKAVNALIFRDRAVRRYVPSEGGV